MVVLYNIAFFMKFTIVLLNLSFFKEKKGHFIGISSLVDEMHSGSAPSYYASKVGFSNYLKGLSLALKSKGVYVTNV